MLSKKRTIDAINPENQENNSNTIRQRIEQESPRTSSGSVETILARSASSGSTSTSLNSAAQNPAAQLPQPNAVVAPDYQRACMSMLDAIPVLYKGCKPATYEVKTYPSPTQPHQFVCEKQRGFVNFIYAISHLLDAAQHPYKESSGAEIAFLSNTPIFKFLARTPKAKEVFINICEAYLNKRLPTFSEKTGACLGDFGWSAERLLPKPVLPIAQDLPLQPIIQVRTPSEQLQGILSVIRIKFIGKRYNAEHNSFYKVERQSSIRFDQVNYIEISGVDKFKEFIKAAFNIANPNAFRNEVANYRCTVHPLRETASLLDFLKNESAFRAIQRNRFNTSTAIIALKAFCESLVPTFTTTTDKLEEFLPETKNVRQIGITTFLR